MKPFARKQPPQPERRHVAPVGRTNAYAYYARRSQERAVLGRQLFRDTNATETARRAASFSKQRFGLLAVVIVTFISLISILYVSADPKVLPADDTATGFLHSMDTYQQASQKLFAGSIWNHNKITLDANGISTELKREYPELSVVSVSLPLIGHRPIVYVAPAQLALVLVTRNGYMYVVDVNGRAVASATSSTPERLHLTNVKDESGADVRVGDLALSSDTVSFIRTILYQLQQKQITVSTMVLPAGKNELDVYPAGKQYYVKFNLESGTALQQAGTYLAVSHDLQSRGIHPAQYVDVRIDGRAYYK